MTQDRHSSRNERGYKVQREPVPLELPAEGNVAYRVPSWRVLR